MDASIDDKSESRLYIGNLDLRITEAALLKMFSPYGKIISEDFLWHTRGPKRGEPRGFAFIQYSTKEEAELAKEKMHGRFACGRPLVVRLAGEKCLLETADKSTKAASEGHKMLLIGGGGGGGAMGQTSRTAKIAAIKNKLKSLEEESSRTKKQKQSENIC
ncbi:probable RNA-binding protein 18 isoform X2 [Vigna unguiculata]|uniref:probable RNA-binding protein 18 isoform X2 n=1 Tax=Vigna unguiculata TaxID=3917 RepID=UPI0010164B1A|nr:probable RNA-binding protein 18 isoform X2 [Vigna unguiculata]XP_027923599.1 probable RNA-binding protein 18 isoform X2 [Vigna unguiculata]XP_027923600.1 probable RNA-binding protein 18 isoform X2 [Vigna unguiculata]